MYLHYMDMFGVLSECVGGSVLHIFDTLFLSQALYLSVLLKIC